MVCCFCGKSDIGYGNSTWPIYPDPGNETPAGENGENQRCCDSCNLKYVIEARINPLSIMKIRGIFGIKCANQ